MFTVAAGLPDACSTLTRTDGWTVTGQPTPETSTRRRSCCGNEMGWSLRDVLDQVLRIEERADSFRVLFQNALTAA